jgi:hypothetical protein
MKVNAFFLNKCQWSRPVLGPFGVHRREGAPGPQRSVSNGARARRLHRVLAFVNTLSVCESERGD